MLASLTPNVMPQRGGPGGTSTFASVAPTYEDLAYANLSSAQKLDLYIPTTGSGPFPVVIMVYGDGFMFGDKADGAGLTGVDQLLAAGYAVASINYRLSGEATYPAQIFDAKAAVRFLRANATEYNLNPDKFGAWGASAGGNLVALLRRLQHPAHPEQKPGRCAQRSHRCRQGDLGIAGRRGARWIAV